MSDRADRVVAGAVLTASVATTLVSAWIGVRSWATVRRMVEHPLTLQETHALLAGLLSAHLMLLQVLFLARLPWLERAWGRDVLTRRHRTLALWSFWLLVAHVLLFVLQRGLREAAFGTAMERLFLTDHWMLWASIGTALILLVVVTSIARARAWLRYESWHLVHLWSYVGIALVLPHILVSVDFVGTWTTVYWWTLYVVVLAAVLVFRVALPLGRSAYHRIRVVEVRPEPGGAVTLTMAGRHLAGLGARSGQFFVWRFLGGRGWTRGHPYSVSASPSADRLRVTVAGAGDGALRASSVAVGTRVLVEGPYGGFTLARRRHPRLLMLGAGVGVTPFRALLESTTFAPGEAALVVRVRSLETALLLDELRELCERGAVALHVLAGPRRSAYSWLPEGTVGDPAEVLTGLVPDVAERDVYLCGPPGWSAAFRTAASRAGVARRDLHEESFGW